MLPIRAIRLTRHDAISLDRMAFEEGEIVFDSTNQCLRLMNGDDIGGSKVLRSDLANIKTTALNKSVNFGTGVVTASQFIGAGIGAILGDTPPAAPTAQIGTLWFNTSSGKLYIYYNDGNSTQWIQPMTPSFSTGVGGATAFSGLSDVSTAGLTVDEIYLPAITRLDVSASGITAYLFDQYAGNNPTIYAISGTTIAFNLANASGHPFVIRYAGADYNTGLIHVTTGGTVTTGASAQDKSSGTLYWKIPAGISGTYGYLCRSHPGGMFGTITIKDISAI